MRYGKTYKWILHHYYSGTRLGSTNPNQIVRVLLQTGAAAFSGATEAGRKQLNPSLTYDVGPLANGRSGPDVLLQQFRRPHREHPERVDRRHA